MALRLPSQAAQERERITSHAASLEAVVRRFDPSAEFVLRPGHDPEFWELVAFVRAGVDDDPRLGAELAATATELLLDYDVAIATIPLPRTD